MPAPTIADETRPPAPWGWRRVAAKIVLPLVLAAGLWWTFGPNPAIQVGPATTRLTAPLGSDGLPDYRRALLDAQQRGVTPDNNAAVPLVIAFWPHEDDSAILSMSQAQRITQQLGVPSPPPLADAFTSRNTADFTDGIGRLLTERLDRSEWNLASDDDADVDADIRRRSDIDAVRWGVCEPVGRPWTAEDIPFMAEWIEKNSAAYDRLVDASHRQAWYVPKVGRLDVEPTTLGPSLTAPLLIRSAFQNLFSRCNYYRGEGRHELAADEALAMLRLCQLAEQAPYNATRMIGFGMEKIGIELVEEMAREPRTTPAALRRLSVGLQALGTPPSFADAMDVGERYATLETFLMASDGGLAELGHRIGRESQEFGGPIAMDPDGP